MSNASAYLKEIQREVASLPASKRKRVLEFARLLRFERLLDTLDPDQAYYWTPKWQEKERAAEADIRAGHVTTYESIEQHKRAITELRKAHR